MNEQEQVHVHEGTTENGQPQGQVPSRDASREMDALIAEKVMGWRRAPKTNPPNRFWPIASTRTWRRPDSPFAVALPHYSTDIAAAWLVVEKLGADRLDVRIYCSRDGFAVCVVDAENLPDITIGRASVDPREGDVALAICRAALAAVSPSPT